jgi:hypothetical protein
VALAPYLPWSTARLGEMLGVGAVSGWDRPEIPGEARLGPVTTLFDKLEPEALDD